MSKVKEFRWAILGSGEVSRKFVLGLRAIPGHKAVVVASRSAENGAIFAKEFGINAADFADAAAWESADAVYVATPPSVHEVHASLAIAAGKPTLIEKPFAIDGAAAARIASMAARAKVFVMEAMWTRFLPLMMQVKEQVVQGKLGELRAFEACFYGNDLPDASVSIFDIERGGGSLMYRGVYGVSLALHLLGPVVDMQVMGRIGDTGVDEDCALTLRHQNGAISTIRSSLRAAGINAVQIYGTKATIRIDPPIYRPSAARIISVTPRKGGSNGPGPSKLSRLKQSEFLHGAYQRLSRVRAFIKPPGKGLSAYFSGNGYGHEALALANAVQAGQQQSQLMPLGQSVEVMNLLDQAQVLMRESATETH